MTKPFIQHGKRVLAGVLALIMTFVLAGCNDVEQTITPDVTTPTEPIVTTEPPVTTTEPTTTEPVVTEPPLPEPLEKYLSYYEENNDFVGWLTIPELKGSSGPYIDYPIVQTTDNSFYLTNNFEKKSSKAGWIYADYKIPITETNHADNITFYGHSQKDGSFFRHLLDYKSSNKGLDLVNKAYVINFDTRWEENRYVIVSCFLIGTKEKHDDLPLFKYFTYRDFKDEAQYKEFYDNIMLRSYFNSDVQCEYGDEFITLSTCAYDFDDSRFVVVARKVREGEDISVYAGTYTKNRDKHMPAVTRD